MTRSSSQNAQPGKSNREDYSPSDRPADAAPGDSLDDDLTADALQPPAKPAAGDDAPRIVAVPASLAGERGR
ncbi:RluA family pseudouridine synthase, partial [Burkholderia dolosa]|nr:RluA family pseudouridine synthase [Burkholderia dolosa]